MTSKLTTQPRWRRVIFIPRKNLPAGTLIFKLILLSGLPNGVGVDNCELDSSVIGENVNLKLRSIGSGVSAKE
ncbi:hypothetical protein Hypma_006967 [Hypsizygus marmoreus]|uniref:Uncharacterized protein n=1 Tax=Hypsizygus marmoreus TaxID=39966 RepID=A0A369JZI8_HYPMA|nr:hypothetical protein Hypma_006967 [Hypsizygus marmoreus]